MVFLFADADADTGTDELMAPGPVREGLSSFLLSIGVYWD
jgi:hypothetical protein